MDDQGQITQLLIAWGKGDAEALAQLVPLVERELHKLARNYMRHENPGHTLQTTALVNEAYLKLVNQKRVRWRNRAQFFAIAAKCMRRVLIDHARKKQREKRGGKRQQVTLSKVANLANERPAQLIALDEALTELSRFAPRKAQVVELRHFGGLTVKETAKLLDISDSTVQRDWEVAKAWIIARMKDDSSNSGVRSSRAKPETN